jgi:SLOG cluster4 family
MPTLELLGNWRAAMIVGVMASGDESLAKKHEGLAKQVGSAIAELGFHLLTGGGGGLMKDVGEAFLDKKRDILDQNRPAGNLISKSKRITAEKRRKTNLASKCR